MASNSTEVTATAWPYKIAVISDTHNKMPSVLPERLSAAQEIWHLGDVCSPSTLRSLESLNKPITVVEGNMDSTGLWPPQVQRTRHGITFRLQHHPPYGTDPEYAAILHGHLHYPVLEDDGICKILSPGAINGPRNGSVSSFAWIVFAQVGQWHWEIEAL